MGTKIQDLTTFEERLRVLAEFILSQQVIPEAVLDTLDGVQMGLPWLHILQEKADKYDAERRGVCPEPLVSLKNTIQYLKDRAEHYRWHANWGRAKYPHSASALDVMARASDRQANHLQGIIDRYYPKGDQQ